MVLCTYARFIKIDIKNMKMSLRFECDHAWIRNVKQIYAFRLESKSLNFFQQFKFSYKHWCLLLISSLSSHKICFISTTIRTNEMKALQTEFKSDLLLNHHRQKKDYLAFNSVPIIVRDSDVNRFFCCGSGVW